MSLSKTLTALSGEYLVAAQLCMNGVVASLTLKNYPGVDIFAFNPKNGKQTAIQVKTTWASNQGYFAPDPKRVESQKTPFVFVYLHKESSPEFYIVDAANLTSLIQEDTTGWWVPLKSLEPHKNKWDNLGFF